MPGKRTNYPTGYSTGITVRGLPLSVSHPGEVFFVNNSSVLAKGGVGGSDGNSGTYQRPFRTIEGALNAGAVTASRGDVLLVMPSHAETLSTAAAISIDKDGVAIIGLGTGLLRPTLTLDTIASSSISWTADYCTLQNFNIIGNVLSVAAPILNSGGAGWTIENCLFKDTSNIKGLLSCVTTTVATNSDDGWFCGNTRYSDATTTPGTAVKVANTTSGLTIANNNFWHSVAENNVAVVLAHGALVLDKVLIENNTIYSINTQNDTGGFIVTTSATTGSGIIRNNHVRGNDPSSTVLVTATAVQYGCYENYYQGEAALASGFLLPGAGGD